MPEAFTTTETALVNGVSYPETFAASGTNIERLSPSVAAAKTGQLTTRTSDTVGTLTMQSSHGITTGARLVVFWSGGSRRVVVGTVSVNSVPFTGGAGDNLPDNLTSITAMVAVVGGTSFPSADMVGLAVKGPVACWFGFVDSAASLIEEYFVDAGKGSSWNDESGATNPLTTAVDPIEEVQFAHGDSTGAKTLYATTVFTP
jgi:hypothetical protein